MPRRLISTDLDGTIVFNGTISLRDREAMARWRAAGNLLVINTGRSVSALEHVVVPMGLEFDNAILYTGAAIVDEDIRVRDSTALPAGVVEDILDFVEGAPGVTVFTTGLDEDLLVYDTIGSGSDLLTLFRPATRRELDGREIIGVPMRFTDPEMASRTETYLHRRWEGQAVGFRNQDFIDVVPASASKGAGLRQLVASLAEPPALETAGDAGEALTGEASEATAGGSVGLALAGAGGDLVDRGLLERHLHAPGRRPLLRPALVAAGGGGPVRRHGLQPRRPHRLPHGPAHCLGPAHFDRIFTNDAAPGRL